MKDINIGDYLDITIETGKVVLQKIDITPKITDQIQLSKNSAPGDSLRSYTPCSRSPSPTPTSHQAEYKKPPIILFIFTYSLLNYNTLKIDQLQLLLTFFDFQ